jgi:hypothetical protein
MPCSCNRFGVGQRVPWQGFRSDLFMARPTRRRWPTKTSATEGKILAEKLSWLPTVSPYSDAGISGRCHRDSDAHYAQARPLRQAQKDTVGLALLGRPGNGLSENPIKRCIVHRFSHKGFCAVEAFNAPTLHEPLRFFEKQPVPAG